MTADPIGLWAVLYPYEEPLAQETDTLASLRQQLGSDQAIGAQIDAIRRVLSQIDPTLTQSYIPWAVNAASYQFSSEAFYQLRLFSLMRDLATTDFALGMETGVVCARQIVRPSAFNGSPRIKRFANVAFVIFPAAMVSWMYVLFELMAASIGKQKFDNARIDEYLRHLIAARSFERWASPVTAYAIDFVLEALVFHKRPPSASPWQAQITPLSLNLVAAVEDFILSHELAHLSLQHSDDSKLDTEAAADRRALDMLCAVDPGTLLRSPAPPELEGPALSLLGYLGLRLWTNIRLAAEMRVLPYVYESSDEVDARRAIIAEKFIMRTNQIKHANIDFEIAGDHFFRSLIEGGKDVVRAIIECTIDRGEANEIRRLAKSFAKNEHNLLSQRMFSDAREKRTQ